MKEYQTTPDGTSFYIGTPQAVIGVLEEARKHRRRLRLFWGDAKTGKCWNQENDVIGYIGRSCGGKYNVPLLIANNRSNGGGAISTDSIVKIIDVQTHCTVYKHEKFHQDKFIPYPKSDMPEYAANVYQGQIGNVYARCHSMQQAERLAAFMNGERMSK
jgi:predicted outer membrane repeat protein